MARPKRNKSEYDEYSYYLRSMRSVTDLSPCQMAKKLGIKRDTYIRYENGKRLPQMQEHLDKLTNDVRVVVRKEIQRKREENVECV